MAASFQRANDATILNPTQSRTPPSRGRVIERTEVKSSQGSKQLLILDLDETLIHATETPLDRPACFCVGPYYVYCRPGLGEFLQFCQRAFRVAIWSSSGAAYLNAIVGQIFSDTESLAFVWDRSYCIARFDPERFEDYFLKDLKKVKRLGFDLNRTLIVDDTPQKVERNYGNAIYVTPFVGNVYDDELKGLSRLLELLVDEPNVRRVEKRGWRFKNGAEPT